MMRKAAPFVVVAVLLVLLVIRFVRLDEDPPASYTAYGPTLLTDPYHLTFAARNAVLFGEWNPFHYHRWDVFRNSLISGAAYLCFEVGGVSRITANIAALLLSCGGIIFFLLGFAGRRQWWEIAITAAVLLLNNLLIVYGRLPYLETGLIFLSGLLFFLFVRYHDRWWGQVICGFLVSMAALAGKLFGFLLIAPVVAGLIYRYRSRSAVPLLLTGLGALAGAALFVLVFYGGNYAIAIDYYHEHTTGLYPYPPGLTSVIKFFKALISYGVETELWTLNPFLLILSGLGVILTLLHISPRERFREEHLPVIFCLVWLLGGIAGLAPFYYRPARYAIFLLLPAAAFVGFIFHMVRQKDVQLLWRDRLVTVPVVLIVCWFLILQLRMLVTPMSEKSQVLTAFVPVSLLIAAVVVLATVLFFHKHGVVRMRRWSVYPVILLLAGVIGWQSRLMWQTLTKPGTDLQQCDRELAAVVDPNAILTGPFMPAFTIDNRLRGVIFAFGLGGEHEDILRRFGITHVLIDYDNRDVAKHEFPELASVPSVVDFLVGGRVIGLYRLPQAAAPMTDFERGVDFLRRNQLDSALIAFGRSKTRHPRSILAATYLALAFAANGNYDDADRLLRATAGNNPNSYLVHARCQYVYEMMYQSSQNSEYLALAKKHADIASQLGAKPVSRLRPGAD